MNLFQTILGNIGLDRVIDSLGNAVDKFVTTDAEREQLKNEVTQIVQNYNADLAKQAYADTASAREMYKSDNWLQKIYAISFLIGYLLLIVVLLWFIYQLSINKHSLPEWAIAFLSTLFGAMSAKVSTITDFLFGSSQGSRKKDLLSNLNNTQNEIQN